MDLTNHSRTTGSDLLLLVKLRWKHQILLQHSADSDLPYSSRFLNAHFQFYPWAGSWGQANWGSTSMFSDSSPCWFYYFRYLKLTLFAHFGQLWSKSCSLAFLRTIYFINKPEIVYHTSCSSLKATIEILRLVNTPWCVKSGKSHIWSL